MELKKIISVLLCCILLIGTCVFYVSAADGLKIEQVVPIMPEINAVVKLPSETDAQTSDCFAKFGDKNLRVSALEKYDPKEHKSCVYFLVDSSGSISSLYLNEIKKVLIDYSNQLTENEKMVVISFGTNVKTVVKGDESKDKRKDLINSLTANESQTNLLKAISYTVDSAKTSIFANYDRSYAVVISDGQNYENQGGQTQQEVLKTVEGHGLPVYAICVGGDSADASKLGSIARESGGEIYTTQKPSEVKDSFNKLINNAENVYLMLMHTEDYKRSDGEKKTLMLRIKDYTNDVELKPTRWIKDDEKPTVTSVNGLYDDGKYKIYVYYSEYVFNADDVANFKLTREETSSDVKLDNAEYFYDMDKSSFYTVLTPHMEPSKADDYILTVEKITDASNELNALESPGIRYSLGERSGFAILLINYWWILVVILIFAGIVVLVILLLKSKKRKEQAKAQAEKPVGVSESFTYDAGKQNDYYEHQSSQSYEQHHIVSPQGRKIELKIYDGKGSVHTVKTQVADRLTFGRAEDCNIYFDDPKMSRYHFVILTINNDFWVEDLNSSNGTMLNNIRIKSKQKLKERDVITAGQQKITVIF